MCSAMAIVIVTRSALVCCVCILLVGRIESRTAVRLASSSSSSSSTPLEIQSVCVNESRDCCCDIMDKGSTIACFGPGCLRVPPNLACNASVALKIFGTNISKLTVDDFRGCDNLTDLKLTGNAKMRHIESGTFHGLDRLASLSISFNNLMEVGVFPRLTSLRLLRLTRNRLTDISKVVLSLSPLKQLKHLILSENRFSVVAERDFLPLADSSVEILELSSCNLSRIHPQALAPLNRLRRLTFGGNFLDETNLIELLGILATSNLQELDMSSMRLADNLTSTTFPAMPSIRLLNLSYCGVTSIGDGTFDHMPNLTSLHLEGNLLASMTSSVLNLTRLEELNVKRISGRTGRLELAANSFAAMYRLKHLDVSFNNIGGINPSTFTGLEHLQVRYEDVSLAGERWPALANEQRWKSIMNYACITQGVRNSVLGCTRN